MDVTIIMDSHFGEPDEYFLRRQREAFGREMEAIM